LEEIKPLVIKYIAEAHDIKKGYCLSKCKQYNLWHEPLKTYYKKHKKTNPTNADQLCFIILLSYPKKIIENLNDISEIKLFSHENTDFIYIEESTLNHEENESDRYDCICSYERLQNVHIVENKYSGIRLQIGSDCITKHKIISNEELKKFKETDKKIKERLREIKEGKPIGYYKEEKQRIIDEKERIKEEKKIEKLRKENEKMEEKIKSGNFKICYYCGISIVDIRKEKLRICNKCINRCIMNNIANVCLQIKSYTFNECGYCEKMFVDKPETDLCKRCRIDNKILKCSSRLCSIIMVVDINTKYIYCDDCEKKINKCIDCKNDYIKENCEERCNYCQYIFDNNFDTKICVSCAENMIIKKTESWRTYCKICYANIKDILDNPPNCKCGLRMTEKTIKKYGKNYGRKGLGCILFPNGCKDFKML
jgi:RNA polymerase-binding transcription factor DksA